MNPIKNIPYSILKNIINYLFIFFFCFISSLSIISCKKDKYEILAKAQKMVQEGKNEEAISYLRDAEKECSENVEKVKCSFETLHQYIHEIAIIYRQIGKNEEGRIYLDEKIKIWNKYSDFVCGLYLLKGDFSEKDSEKLKNYDKAYELANKNNVTELINLADRYNTLLDLDKVEKSLNKAYKLTDKKEYIDNHDLIRNLAMIQYLKGDSKLTKKICEDPDDYIMGFCLNYYSEEKNVKKLTELTEKCNVDVGPIDCDIAKGRLCAIEIQTNNPNGADCLHKWTESAGGGMSETERFGPEKVFGAVFKTHPVVQMDIKLLSMESRIEPYLECNAIKDIIEKKDSIKNLIKEEQSNNAIMYAMQIHLLDKIQEKAMTYLGKCP